MMPRHDPSEPLPADVNAALHRGDKLEAIKRLSAARHLDLGHAKDVIDAYIRNDFALRRKYQQHAEDSRRTLWLIGAAAVLVLLYLLLF